MRQFPQFFYALFAVRMTARGKRKESVRSGYRFGQKDREVELPVRHGTEIEKEKAEQAWINKHLSKIKKKNAADRKDLQKQNGYHHST